MRNSLLAAAFAIFLLTSPARAQFCPGASGWVFDDVLASDAFCGYITWMAQNGVSLGCQIIDANHRLYCPANDVSRSQLAAFLNRLTAQPDSTAPDVGTITKPGGVFLHNGGAGQNTFLGVGAGNFSATFGNTGIGYNALVNNTAGYNVAVGASALTSNTTGSSNTAVGGEALRSNVSGFSNTGIGTQSLGSNWSGTANTAVGAVSLATNTTGSSNTAIGAGAMEFSDTGSENTAVGSGTLFNNKTGSKNVAVGIAALNNNVTGDRNTAVGAGSLAQSTSGMYNVAIGDGSLIQLLAGSSNVVIGPWSGQLLATGEANIYLANSGAAAESYTMRLGEQQTRAYVAGVRGVSTGLNNAVNVVIDSNGQLGTISSSRSAKDDVADMSEASASLMQLRPVTFHYKADHDPSGRRLQYGLIAEEVAEVYPGMVATKDGRAETVMYQFLAPMLLNEYQKQQRTIEAQARELAAEREARVAQAREIAELKRAVEALMAR